MAHPPGLFADPLLALREREARRSCATTRLNGTASRGDAQGQCEEAERDRDGHGERRDRKIEEQSHGARRVAEMI
jgi:hypothetical protein